MAFDLTANAEGESPLAGSLNIPRHIRCHHGTPSKGNGDIGAQLDMMYHDQIESTTTWKDHIAKVKKDVPAPSEQPSYDDIALTGTIEKPAWEA